MTGIFHTKKNLHPDLIKQIMQLCSDPKARMETWVHHLKAWPEFFDAVADGRKTFEVRRNDRGYREGDIITLLRYEPERGSFTMDEGGRTINLSRRITYVLEGGQFGIEYGFVVLGLGPVEASP
jgi:hypothetical protein